MGRDYKANHAADPDIYLPQGIKIGRGSPYSGEIICYGSSLNKIKAGRDPNKNHIAIDSKRTAYGR